VSLDCPSDCPYLQQARLHERSRNLSTIEASALFPQVELPRDLAPRLEPLITGLSYTMVQIARRDRALLDRDIVAVLTALAKTYETLAGSGLLYEVGAANPVQQAVSEQLQKMIAGYRQIEREERGYSTLRDAEILQVIVFLLRVALMRGNGRPRSRAFLDSLRDSFPQEDGFVAGPPHSGSGLILP
jgi:hypothetical protein